ncbi:MAG: GspE/PulE family protein, partial [Rhodobacteraceae bacterium]|nr:GspE/PulE family protein [Paracoccaceae bacterium]
MAVDADIKAVFAAIRRRLEAEGVLTAASWDRAERARAGVNERVDRVLVKLGLVSEARLADSIAEELGLRRMAAEDLPLAPYPLGRVSVAFLRAHLVAPLQEDDEGCLKVALADPFESFPLEALSKALDRELTPVLALSSDVDELIGRFYEEPAEADPLVGSSDDDVERLRDLASEAPIIRLVNELIEAAVRMGASDVHLERTEAGVRVRCRVDGSLRDHRTIAADEAQAIVSRIKIMARLDIAERRLPQDGRIRTTSSGRAIDLRVSTLPALDGEAVVLRILDRAQQPLGLPALGLDPEGLSRFEAMLARPNGIILVTGPTGSGKTTTLYAALQAIASPERKFLTVEDPVEYRLADAVQVQVKPDIGLDFASALRAFLRHDPDVVMIGEIRDAETAKIAAQAALTGHLVLSTLHTNSASAAVGRLLDMGVEDYLLGSTLNGAIAQRLVRRLCQECKQPIEPPHAGRLAEALTEL